MYFRTKMYKSRITKWGFDRKYRKRNGNTSRRSIEQQPRERFSDGASPKTSPNCSMNSGQDKSSTKESLTKPTTWQPAADMTTAVPQTLPMLEHLDRAIFSHFRASFRSKLWVSDGEDIHCRSVKAPANICETIARFKHDLFVACEYIGQGGGHFGLMYLDQGSEKIKDILLAESPRVVADLIEISLRLTKEGRYDVVQIFLQQFADMSAVVNNESQAIYRILAQKSKLDKSAFEEAALGAWHFIADCFMHELGPTHVTALCCYTNWLVYFANTSAWDKHICRSQFDHAEYAENCLRSELKRCDDARGPGSTQSAMVLQALVQVLLARHKYAEAEGLCNEIMLRARKERRHVLLLLALTYISDAQRAQKKFNAANANLTKLADISASNRGRDSSMAVHQTTMDPLSESLTHSFKWLRGESTAFCMAMEDDVERLKNSKKSTLPASKPGSSLEGRDKELCPNCKRGASIGQLSFS